MRVPTQLRRSPVGFNMTPMIDVVFLLIIFFLVSSHLARQEAHLELPLPTADSGQLEPPVAPRRLTLNIQVNGSLLLAGRAVPLQQLEQRLQAARQQQEDLEIRIRSDRQLPYRLVEPVMLACARAGIWNVTFAVFRPEDAP